MIYFGLIFCVALLVISKQSFGNWAAPAPIYCIAWSFGFLGLVIAGDFFLEISAYTYLLYILGLVALVLGCQSTRVLFPNRARSVSTIPRRAPIIIDTFALISIVSLPAFLTTLRQISFGSGISDYWIGLRAETSTGFRYQGGLTLIGYLVSLITFTSWASLHTALVGAYPKWKMYIVILTGFLYQVLTAGRSGAVTLTLGIGCILLIHHRLKIRALLVGVLSLAFIFAVPAILLKKGGERDASAIENLRSVGESFTVYAFSGMVAFDNVVRNPGLIPSNNRSTLFFQSVYQAMGFEAQIESTLLEYSYVPHPTNVYTIYFPFFSDYGPTGMLFIIYALGVLTTLIYSRAAALKPVYIIPYAVTFAALLLSPFTETLITGLSYWIQSVLVSFAIFYQKGRVSRPLSSRSPTQAFTPINSD